MNEFDNFGLEWLDEYFDHESEKDEYSGKSIICEICKKCGNVFETGADLTEYDKMIRHLKTHGILNK